MEIIEALTVKPGDRVKCHDDLFVVLGFPELKETGNGSFVRIALADHLGHTQIFSHEELTFVATLGLNKRRYPDHASHRQSKRR